MAASCQNRRQQGPQHPHGEGVPYRCGSEHNQQGQGRNLPLPGAHDIHFRLEGDPGQVRILFFWWEGRHPTSGTQEVFDSEPNHSRHPSPHQHPQAPGSQVRGLQPWREGHRDRIRPQACHQDFSSVGCFRFPGSNLQLHRCHQESANELPEVRSDSDFGEDQHEAEGSTEVSVCRHLR